MRQAAFTSLRRSTQTPTLNFGSLPTFDITSGTPPNLGIGPSKPVPLPRPNSSSSSTMVSNLPTRSPYENPFANPPPSQQLDYFNCKPLPVPSVEQHPYRCKVSSPLSHSSAAPRSYWSPAVTPAPLQVLTRSSSPVLSSAGITPDDIGNLFPYISYESSPAPTPASDTTLPLPTPPPSSVSASFSSSITTSSLVDIKIYFVATHDLIKIRLPGSASLEDLKSKAAERMSGGCKSLHVAKAGVDTRDPSDVAKADLAELGGERQWRSWLEAVAQADRRSGAGKQRRIVLWAM
ncbi:hypothetical protein FRC04_000033 [Tulasnella sp. 424]|nr:hypothetical protein FRC04_000033 [Tulasnella sp. 424]KAG8981896.1 hypothetical protein FRC05_000038 [Tulasnella sp. 425]